MADRRTAPLLVGGVASNAVATLLPQVLALFMLPVVEYATFSLLFIALGLTYSAQNSVVVDPWLREGARAREVPYGPLATSAALLAAVASMIPLALGYVGYAECLLVGGGILASQLRSGLRLFLVGCSEWTGAIVNDVLFLVGFAGAVVLTWGSSDWSSVWIPMLVGAVVASVPSIGSFLRWRSSHLQWFSSRRHVIAPLWVESFVLDLGVAAPLLVLAKLMVPSEFAVVRAAYSALIPVRLVLATLRAWISQRSPDALAAARFVAQLLALAVGLGAVITIAVEVLGSWSIASEGVLPSLVPYSVALALMGALQFLSGFVYLVARTHASPRALLVGRVTDTLIQMVSVLVGFLLGGLTGVVTGFVVLSFASLVIWALVVRTARTSPA